MWRKSILGRGSSRQEGAKAGTALGVPGRERPVQPKSVNEGEARERVRGQSRWAFGHSEESDFIPFTMGSHRGLLGRGVIMSDWTLNGSHGSWG